MVCHSTAATDVGDLTRVLPKLDHIIVVDRRHSVSSRGRWLAPLRRRRRPSREATGTHLLSLRDLIETHRPITRAAVVDGHDLAAIQYGPGGERGAVGVRRSHANLEASAFQSRLWLAETRAGRERVLAATPFSQPYGLTAGLLAGVLSGATLVLVPRFDMDHIITAVNSHRPTLFPATEPMLTTFVESDTGVDFASLRVCLAAGIGGASGEVVRRFQTRFGTRTRRAYGPVAAASLTHANPVYGAAGKIGLPLPDTTAAVIDPARPEIPLEPGEPGELAVHGPQVMTGLWGSPSAVGHGAGPRVVDGWLLTGETAVMDQAGYFELTAGSLPGDGAAVRRIASPSGRRGGDDGS